MSALLLLVPLLPLLGSALLMISADRIIAPRATWIACGTVGVSALLVLILGADLMQRSSDARQISVLLGHWIAINGFDISPALRLDPLSLVMAFVITFVGFLIHLYSSDYMAGEEGYARYFAWLNLFVGAMLLLVLADDLLLLYFGWEGVGLCSYLLIGFWYKEPQNGYAARKAFVMTRMGDVLLLIGVIFLATHFNTLRIDDVVAQARAVWLPGASVATLISLLLLGGAIGKSAQVPLHTWLPDAMAGPTPVSALIHAATMVTAGVYLIARLHGLFALSPLTLNLIAIIGAITLLLGASSALAQSDIKRVLAYSTISQIGYMFLALGLGAWSAAIFHLFTHAFFKALLFLGAGAVILAANHQQEMEKLGGLRKGLPLVFWTFVIGGASLAALPLVTAGFFSKDLILINAWRSPVLWLAGWIGAVLTAAYILRLIFHTFFAPRETAIHRRPRWTMAVPLVVLAIGAVVAGFFEWPSWIANLHLFTAFLVPLFGGDESTAPIGAALLAMAAPFIGAFIWWRGRGLAQTGAGLRTAPLLRDGWRFDALYAYLFERPWNALARHSAGEVLDGINAGIIHLHRWAWSQLSAAQSGRVRHYAAAVASGAVLLLLMTL